MGWIVIKVLKFEDGLHYRRFNIWGGEYKV